MNNEFSFVNPSVIRLHTLFGIGIPPKNMFLGQIFNSLKNKTKFNMSDGNQFRQYHHYNEVSNLLNMILSSKSNEKIIDLSGEIWIKLKDLANSIYSYFDCLELLNIGSLKKSQNEIINTNNQFISNGDFQFENPLMNINKYLEMLLNE